MFQLKDAKDCSYSENEEYAEKRRKEGWWPRISGGSVPCPLLLPQDPLTTCFVTSKIREEALHTHLCIYVIGEHKRFQSSPSDCPQISF